MKEGILTYLSNVCAKGYVLDKNDSRMPHSVTEGHSNAIDRKYLVRQHVSTILRIAVQ